MDSTKAMFARHNLRCTEQRAAVYEMLRACKTHPTAEELLHLTRSRLERISLATVYNTLEVLCEAGLARKFPMGNGCCRYDGDTSDHLHVRFRDTFEMEDVPEDLGQQLVEELPREVIRRIEQRLNVRIDGLNLQLLATRDNA